MMQATRLEYRYRMATHAIIFWLGFSTPWDRWLALDTSGVKGDSAWLILSSVMWRQGWMHFQAATVVLLVWALVCMALGAWLRTWGTAYVSAGVMRSRSMHGQAMLADGPYRRTRNPLYLGTLLHTMGLAILMPPSGAIFAVAAIWVLQVRLALAEEPFLLAQFGAAYAEYCVRVPRFVPALRPRVPAAGAKPHWGQAVLGELYFWGALLTLAVFGWSFNANYLQRGILISLGAWFIALALLPRAKTETAAAVP